ncbi:hypothetical protein [Phenylobacterium sp.]|uniref:hypothetical protein n=1 Tax=Phenylobacterium sp. TaxID=1871053 RepID=UPI0035B2F112
MLPAAIRDEDNEPRQERRAAGNDREVSARNEPTPGYLDQDVSRFFYRWGGHLSATLVRVRARFDGDLDQYLLYLVFLLSELQQTIAAGGPSRSFAPRRGLNALSLSDITQIPRETARRKLLALADRGYLLRDEQGLFVLGDRYGLDEFFLDLKPLFWDAVRVER